MYKKNHTQIIMIIFFLISIPISAQQSNEQGWKKLAQKENLSEKAIGKLAENNIVITDKTYKQIFTPYVEGGGDGRNGKNEISLFITTDSLINAYHVLYEESILRLEKINANRLEGILKFVLANLQKTGDNIKAKPELVKTARERAFIVVGTAMKLQDENYKAGNNNIEKIINEEVEKIKEAAANEKPSWLGEPTDDLYAIDYSRYKPRGFYTKSEQLSKYFRAVSWLQSIPFRLDKDDELLSILMLGNCLNSNQFGSDTDKYQNYTNYFSTFKMLIGSGDDWDVVTAKEQIASGLNLNLDGNDLNIIRQKMNQKLNSEGGSQINDHVRFPPLNPNVAAEPQFRFISAYRTPDAVLFHRTTDLREFDRPLPNGLEVCAALGSEFAKSKLEYSDKAKLLKTIEETKSVFNGDSLYLDYLQCLACLLDEPPAKSPDFMKNYSWQAKSCNTTLAGWSQLRHTWSLQAKQSVSYKGITFVPSGFVEPEPEFYNKLAQLARKSMDILDKAGAFDDDYSEISRKIMAFIKLQENNNTNDPLFLMRELSEDERLDMYFVEMLALRLRADESLSSRNKYTNEDLAKLTKLAQDLSEGKLPEDERLRELIQEQHYDIKSLWGQLENMSSTLEEISRKQLDGDDLKEYERFLKMYGINLAKIMFYNQNSYEGPKDDSMRIIDVHYAPDTENEYLEVGIARARAIYVLYPWQGSLFLCRGAVMPYYEFKSNSRLTDAEWKKSLNSNQRPDVPEWFKPVIDGSNLTIPPFIRAENAKLENEQLILEAAASQLNKKPDELKEEDYNQIMELELSGPKLVDISIIGRFHNLQKLKITGGNLDKVDVIRTLRNLETLEITNSKVSNINMLSRPAKLQSLNLSGTQVSDISQFANISTLKILNLSNTQVDNIASLAKLKNLKTLDVRGTKVSEDHITEIKKMLPHTIIKSDEILDN